MNLLRQSYAPQEVGQNGFLRMQPIVRLWEEHAAVTVGYRVGNLFAAVGRQAVHYQYVVILRSLQQPLH